MSKELEELSLKVAAIAGWTEIRQWDTSRNQEIQPKKKLFVGNNPDKSLGIFIPDYVESIDAIAKVFLLLKLQWDLVVAWDGRAYASSNQIGQPDNTQVANTPAIALCKLLLEINPEPIREVAVIDDDGEVKSQVLEASFG